MLANRSRDTGPELALRSILHGRGYRYRVNYRPLRDKRNSADIVFTKAKVAVFVDGCYWHGCPEHYWPAKTNVHYWAPKIAANKERDELFNEALAERGWTVVRAWEHEAPEDVAERVALALRRL
ncbi:very short patch repair endonuclease [Phytoactinopolyspora halotolerans]|uniref:Very short patch repair endonuclease n=2 Tax=Phytoactinopolyspora halotolerans TaxID=1981512 RepID=A0A6L9SEN1_9ACTN|nr:very short patch repair endonuclease [Phytoactinopolyspora halotolerans]